MSAVAALLVVLGAAVGAPLRLLVAHRWDDRWPRGTLAVNLAGSLLLGGLVGAAVGGHALALLGTGFCGALTTYSSFAVQAVTLGGRRGTAYAGATIGGCLLLATLGHLLARTLF